MATLPRPRGTRLAAAALAVNLAALTLLALWFRCRALGNIPGLNGNKAWYGVTAWNILHGGSWPIQTPGGNPLNPFYFALLLPLHACFRPSITLLRIVPLASGLAALALNWWLCRRVFDRPTAVISTLMLALLPIDIAYSRFAWDASQSLPATLLVWYFSLAAVRFPERQDRFTAAAIVALLAAVLIHPTNVFAGAAIAASLTALAAIPHRAAALTVLALAAIALILWAAYMVHAAGAGGGVRRATSRNSSIPATRPTSLCSMQTSFPARPSINTFPAPTRGCNGPRWAEDRGDWDWCWFGACWRPPPGDSGDAPAAADRVLVAGWLLELAAFAVLAGPEALLPGQERYAICLVAPAVLLAARGAAVWWTQGSTGKASGTRHWHSQWHTAAVVLALAAAWLVAADFHQHYFRFIEQTGGQAHRTFRTATIEPKLAALDYILQHRTPGATWIAADDYWSYLPLRYFALADNDIHVVKFDDKDSQQALTRARAEGRAWYVRFCPYAAHAVCGEIVTRRVTDTGQILDYAGRPVLCVSHPSP